MGKIEEKNLVAETLDYNMLGNPFLAKKILELTSDSLIILDNQYRCIDLLLKTENPILNQDLIGKCFIDVLPQVTAKAVKRELNFVLETGQTSNLNYDLPTNGKMYYFKLIVQKFEDDFLLCQYRDITKRSNMKGRLRSAARALMEVGEIAQITHWSYDLATEELSFPEYSTEEDIIFFDSRIVGLKQYLQTVHEDDRLLVKNFLNNPNNQTLTVEYRTIQDQEILVYLRSTRYKRLDSSSIVSGFTQNVTDFMKNRHELEMIVSVVHNSPKSVMAAKSSGEIIFVNKKGLRIAGFDEDRDIQGLHIRDLVSEFSTLDKWNSFKEALAKSEGEYQFRIKQPNPELNIIEMDCVSSVIKNWEGQDIIWFFQHDISDQIRYEEQLVKSKEAAEESEKLKMAFISNMSHEIRTPLSAIVGLSMLVADTEEAELRHEYTKLISSNSDQLLRLITDVLEMSKLDSGNMGLILKLESLHGIMHELALSFNHIEDKAKVYLDIPNKDTEAYLDKGRVMQLLTNMINNSRKFTPPTGEIHLGYYLVENRIEMFVRDTGIGIPRDQQSQIFNRFFKVNQNDIGTGLGLAICKSIVDQMEGTIDVQSEVGKGTCFRIALPLIKDLPDNK